jgi:hypothetical protein
LDESSQLQGWRVSKTVLAVCINPEYGGDVGWFSADYTALCRRRQLLLYFSVINGRSWIRQWIKKEITENNLLEYLLLFGRKSLLCTVLWFCLRRICRITNGGKINPTFNKICMDMYGML